MKQLLFSCLILLCIISQGQSNLTPGILIENSGDSIYGDIDYKDWTKNPSTVSFTAKNGTVKTLSPGSVRGFIVLKTKEHYESFEVSVDLTPTNYNTVLESRLSKPETQLRKAFLLHLVTDSLLSLYIYTDNNKPHLYISSPNGNPTELVNQYLYVEGQNMLRENRAYREQLQTVLADCPSVAQQAKYLVYQEVPVRRLIVKYLKCMKPNTFKDNNNERRLTVKFGVVAGVMHNSFKFTGRETKSLVSGDYKQNISPVIGAVVDIGFRVNNNKWFIVNELIYKHYKTSHSYFTHTILYDYTTSLDFSFPYLQINTLLRYRFPVKGIVKPYLNSGMGNGYLLSESKNDVTIVYTDGRPTTTKKGIDGINRYEQSLIFGAGVDIKHLQFEARYTIGNGFSPFVNTKSKVYSPQFILSYRL